MYAGKFAQVCQTTKDALRHYDEIGLLKPTSINENGYKVYSASQIIDFLAIASLQEAGFSLEEIRNFQKQHDPAMTLRLFNSKKAEIEAKARKLKESDSLLNRQLHHYRRKRNGNQVSWTAQTTGAWSKRKNPTSCRQESLCKVATRKTYF